MFGLEHELDLLFIRTDVVFQNVGNVLDFFSFCICLLVVFDSRLVNLESRIKKPSDYISLSVGL
jgi:hypothetical protein